MHTQTFTIDLSAGNHNQDVQMPGFPPYSLQAVWSGVTGGTNGTIKLKQSNDGTNYDQIRTIDEDGEAADFGISIASASGSGSVEDKLGFTGIHMRIAVAVGSITAGTLVLTLNLK